MASLALLKPDLLGHPLLAQEALRRIHAAGIRVLEVRWKRLSEEEAAALYAEHRGKFFEARLRRHVTSAPTLGLRLAVADAAAFRALLGPLRADFRLSDTRNAAHGSDPDSAEREAALFFTHSRNQCDDLERRVPR